VADVLVVGGGIIGLLSALELRARGAQVAIYDAGVAVPSASWAGGGILSPLFPWRYSDAMNALCLDAFEHYQGWAEQIVDAGGKDPEVFRCGMLALCQENQGDVEQWAQRFKQPQSWVEGQGYWLSNVGNIRNSRLLKGLLRLALRRGITVNNRAVDHVVADADGVTVFAGDERRCCDRVLIAAGWRSSELMRRSTYSSSVSGDQEPPFFPAKGEMLLYRTPPGTLNHIILSENGYLIPRCDGHILVGSTHQPGVTDLLPSEQAEQTLIGLARELLPSLVAREPVAHWSGVRPGHTRDVPVIDSADKYQRVWLSTGHYRNGLVAAPASARLVAQRICGDQTDLSSADYSFSSPGSSDSFCSR
jgi:glycine oxidase